MDPFFAELFDEHKKIYTNFFKSLTLCKKVKERRIILTNALRDTNSPLYTIWPLMANTPLRNALFEKLDTMYNPSAGYKDGVNMYRSFIDEQLSSLHELNSLCLSTQK